MRFLDLYEKKNDVHVNYEYTYKDALKDIESKNLYNLICNIHKAKHNTGASTTGFYIGGDFIEYNDPKFTDLSRKLIAKYGDKLKDELKAAAHKRVIKGIPNIKIAEDDKVFIDSKLASYLENPNLAIKNIGNAKKSNDKIGDEITYRKIGEALVYRTTEFVSKLANTTTKINSTKFKQLMIDAFNAEEEENFLYGIVDIEAKMRIDAAKQTVQQVAGNNDALNKFGADKSDELENESISDSYYADISAELKTTNLLYESENVPRKVSQFSNNARIAAKQANAVEATWPRQFKSWYEKYKAAFDEGVKKGQDVVRKGGAGDEKYVEDPLTLKKIDIRKGWGTGGPQAYIDDLAKKYPSVEKAISKINEGPLTIFNMGPRLILGLCKGLSTGGKILQQIEDDFAEGFKDIKEAFKSKGSTKEYKVQVEKSIKAGNYGEAVAEQSVVIVVDCSQLLNLMENGPIGTVDFDNSTFSTANSNDQTSLEVAVQNLIGQLSKYSDVYKKYENNKGVIINKVASDTVINKGKEEKSKAEDEDEEEEEEDAPAENSSTKPVYRPFTQFLTEADEDESKADNEDESDDESSSTQEDQLNASLDEMSFVKQLFENNLDIPRLKKIHEVLKSFVEGDELKNKNGGLDSLKTIIDLYDIMIKNDLNFDLKSDSIKNFVDGLRTLNEAQEIPKIENQPINISPDIKIFPAMEHTGTPKKKISSEENAKNLADTIKASFTDSLINEVEALNSFARSCKDDSWFNEYKAKNEKLNELKDKLTAELETVYGSGNIGNWYYKALEELDQLNYLPKLYKLMAIGSCIASQLEDQIGEEMEESVEPEINIKKKGTLYRSLYEADENSEQNEQDNETEEQDDKEDPFEVVKHNIPTLEERLDSVDFRHILPPDKNHKVYQINSVEQFNQYMRSFANNAERGLAIIKGTAGNGIVPIARNIVSQNNDAGKMMRDHLNSSGCKQICAMFNEGTDKNREHSDLYAYYATSWAILKHSKEVFTRKEGEEDNKERAGLNRESDNIKESYQFPGVSPDALINEIYKYIRGSK